MKSKHRIAALFIAASLLVPIAAIGGSPSEKEQPVLDRHTKHRALHDDVRHRGVLILDSIYETTPVIRHHMIRALESYQELSEALTSDDIDRADRAAAAMASAVDSVPTKSLREQGLEAWHQHATLYERVLREFQHESALTAKRSYFAHLSEIVYCTVKSFGLGAELSNVYFCPMALDGKGAFWLSESTEVHNPYFGRAMEGCGNLSETLGP